MSRWAPERLDRGSYPGPGADLPVLYGDLDTNGHLNNVQLGRFFEHARLLTTFSRSVLKTLEPGRFLVARVAIDYVTEGHLGSDLHVRTRVQRFGRTSLALEQAAWQDARVVGLSEVVLTYLVDGVPTPLPDATRAVLAPLA